MYGMILIVATGVDLVTDSLIELNKVPIGQLHCAWPRIKKAIVTPEHSRGPGSNSEVPQ